MGNKIMLIFGVFFVTLLFFSFILIVTSTLSYIYSLIYFYIYKKANYILLILLNLIILIPAHLFYGGQITYTFKRSYHYGTLGFTFYIGFVLYLCLLSSSYIHKIIINKLLTKQQKENK